MTDSFPATAACSRADSHNALSMRCQECGYQPGPATAAERPFFLSFGEAYMDGNADAFGEIHGYLTGAAIGANDDAVRKAMLSAAEYVRSRQRDCDKSRWEMRDARTGG